MPLPPTPLPTTAMTTMPTMPTTTQLPIKPTNPRRPTTPKNTKTLMMLPTPTTIIIPSSRQLHHRHLRDPGDYETLALKAVRLPQQDQYQIEPPAVLLLSLLTYPSAALNWSYYGRSPSIIKQQLGFQR
mmetsp:Transcript_25695/g.83312  ORF Transcript_25695/g.83312 Transcript_25695/m.83312 type:complete len:129 (-) Transcript_25695:483-869(-)